MTMSFDNDCGDAVPASCAWKGSTTFCYDSHDYDDVMSFLC